MNKIELVRDYFSLICGFSTDPEQYLRFVQPTAEWIEHPNAITPQTRVGDLASAMRGAEAGKKLLSAQKITIESFFESGDRLLVEGLWEGTVSVAAGKFTEGQTLRAHLAMVFTFQGGKISRQVNYDCYEAF